MASANVLFPDPLFPIITLRSTRGSCIQLTDYSRVSCKITFRSLVIEANRQQGATSALGHSRRLDRQPLTSGLPRSADIPWDSRHLAKVAQAEATSRLLSAV